MRKADPKDPVKFQKTVQKVLKRQDNMVELMTLVPWPFWTSWPSWPSWLAAKLFVNVCYCLFIMKQKQQHLAPTLKLDPEAIVHHPGNAEAAETSSSGEFWWLLQQVFRQFLVPRLQLSDYMWDELVTFFLILCGCAMAMTSKFVWISKEIKGTGFALIYNKVL